jgi:formiminoglutamase
MDVKASQWIVPWDGAEPFDIGLLGAPLSKTSISHSGAHLLPQTVRAALASYGTYHLDADVDLADRLVARDLGDVEMHPTDLLKCQTNVYEATRDYFSARRTSVLLLVGGDHSISASSIRAFAETAAGPIGVIHFDAHHDMRNLEDGGPTNGTPFRRLLESGALDGTRLVQIGLRNFANAKAYTQYAKSHGVTMYTMNRLQELGREEVLAQALAVAGRDGADIYVSFDLDVLDPSVAPGVPAPSPGGMNTYDALWFLEHLGKQKRVRALDVVCADPTVDVRNLTSRVAANLLLHFACGVALRA